MSDELTVEGKNFISSKRASEVSGYAQDYIGQLARKQLIGARRIGGLWYVEVDSLTQYQRKAEEYKPQPPIFRPDLNAAPDTVISLEGKDYISAARAAEVTSYHQDYVGQLARSGSVLSRQIGNRWYVDREGIVQHKASKDALLAAVQADSVGFSKPEPAPVSQQRESDSLRYFSDTGDLIPAIAHAHEPEQQLQRTLVQERKPEEEKSTPVPIRRLDSRNSSRPTPRMLRGRSRAPLYVAAAGLATIVVVLSIGFTSLKSTATYTMANKLRNTAAVLGGAKDLESIADFIETYFIPQLTYTRR